MEKTMMVTREFRKDGVNFCQDTPAIVNYNPIDRRFYATNVFGQSTDVSREIINNNLW